MGIGCAASALACTGLTAADPAYGDIGWGLLAVFAAAVLADGLLLTLPRRSAAGGIMKALALFCVNALLFTAAGIRLL